VGGAGASRGRARMNGIENVYHAHVASSRAHTVICVPKDFFKQGGGGHNIK
jgi:hypothetical protein